MNELLPYSGPAVPAGMYEPLPSGTLGLDAQRQEVFDMATAMLNPTGQRLYAELANQDEGQESGRHSGTFYHQLEVGVLVYGALSLVSSNSNSDTIRRAVAAANFHDMGKRREAVRQLITLPRRLDDDERAIVAQHTGFGAEDLTGAFHDERDEQIGAFCALHHHRPQPEVADSAANAELCQYAGLVRIADLTQAILMDWSRTYKADRMTHEGLLRGGSLVTDKAIEAILGGNTQRRFLGAAAASVVEIARQYMPAAEWISEQVHKARARVA